MQKTQPKETKSRNLKDIATTKDMARPRVRFTEYEIFLIPL